MKDAIGFRQFNLSSAVESRLAAYQTQKFPNLKSHEIARAIQSQSDYYIQYPLAKTPWRETAIQMAQIFYYLPLNYMRNVAVADEIAVRYPQLKGKSAIDFGAGLGAASIAIQERLSPKSIRAIEISTHAAEISKNVGLSLASEYLTSLPSHIEADTLGWFSYSLTEVINPMPLLLPFDHIVIVEPSTQKDSQLLIDIRQNLIDAGYEILAPCTHQNKCPLQGNRSDWCHDKIQVVLSESMQQVEQHLAWKNSDLTFSYLVASRNIKNAVSGKIRMIGDPQFEKGKTRQMICRGSEREFFSWLDRDKSFTEIARGAVIDTPANHELKGNELRIKTKL